MLLTTFCCISFSGTFLFLLMTSGICIQTDRCAVTPVQLIRCTFDYFYLYLYIADRCTLTQFLRVGYPWAHAETMRWIAINLNETVGLTRRRDLGFRERRRPRRGDRSAVAKKTRPARASPFTRTTTRTRREKGETTRTMPRPSTRHLDARVVSVGSNASHVIPVA